VNASIRRKLAARNRRIKKRLDPTKMGSQCPVISASNIQYEIADRTLAVAAGGIGAIQQMVKRRELDKAMNERLNVPGAPGTAMQRWRAAFVPLAA
jgi:hypothetical protein